MVLNLNYITAEFPVDMNSGLIPIGRTMSFISSGQQIDGGYQLEGSVPLTRPIHFWIAMIFVLILEMTGMVIGKHRVKLRGLLSLLQQPQLRLSRHL